MKLTVRKADRNDYPRFEEIYAYAREQMKKNGNPTQWGDSRPLPSAVIDGIEEGNTYAVVREDRPQYPVGVFYYRVGIDETYLKIWDGDWSDEGTYAVIHRVASDGTCHGVCDTIFRYCEARGVNLRIDTHKDNTIMQKILHKNGFIHCGTILTDDGTPRLAYEKTVETK